MSLHRATIFYPVVAMEKFFFSLLILLAFFLSLDSLTSGDKEIKLSDEIFWLFNEDFIVKKMDAEHIKALILSLEASQIELLKEGSEPQTLKELKRARAALEKAKELDAALSRLVTMKASQVDLNPYEKTLGYCERTKHDLLKLLREFYQDDEILEESFK